MRRMTQGSVATTFVSEARGFGGGASRYTHPFLMLAACLALYPPRLSSAARALPLFLLPALTLVGYFLIYVITPFDLTWHLATSLDRLCLQVWPMIVFLVASSSSLGRRFEPGRASASVAGVHAPAGHAFAHEAKALRSDPPTRAVVQDADVFVRRF